MSAEVGRRDRALVFLRSRAVRPAAERSADLAKASAALGPGSNAGVALRLWAQVDDDPIASAFASESYDAVIDIESADGADALLAALGALDLHATSFDLARSGVTAGRLHTLDPGEGPMGLFFCMGAKPGMSVEEFHTYWRHEHAVHHAHRDGAGYQQLHADSGLTTAAADASGVPAASYGGVAIAVIGVMPPAGGGRADRGDRVNFVDPATEVGMIANRVA